MNRIIGKVTSSERHPSTSTSVSFWVKEDETLRPFDVVRIQHEISNSTSYSYAIITELSYVTDSPGYLSDFVSSDFGDVDSKPLNKRLGATIATADVLYNNHKPEPLEMPIRDGALVEWADTEGIQEALGISDVDQKSSVPAGFMPLSNGDQIPIVFQSQYLLGPEGAHLNIAGISGLATKTSYAMFLLNSIQQKHPDNVSMIVFNVKGRDLLALDMPPEDIGAIERVRDGWRKCGLEARPFSNVTYLYPYSEKPENGYTDSRVPRDVHDEQVQMDRAFNYYYGPGLVEDTERFSLLFSDIPDESNSMDNILDYLRNDKAFHCHKWQEIRDEVKKRSVKGGGGDHQVVSWRKFKRNFDRRTSSSIFTEHLSTIPEKRRMKTIEEVVSAKLRPGVVIVVDIEPLPSFLQNLVVGDTIKQLLRIKLGDHEELGPEEVGTVVVFADELNKYAPKSGSKSALAANLVEITARGRSLGVVLFGAEQFRSGVNDEVLLNCSTNVYGRTSPVEISKGRDYSHFPKTYEKALLRLQQGELLLQHAVFKTSVIKTKFPEPAYRQLKEKRNAS